MSRGSVFSESWYKVSGLQVSLNTNNYIKKQLYRGEEWYVIEDSYNNNFFKIKPEAYEFIVRLDHTKTVEEVWEICLQTKLLLLISIVAPKQGKGFSLMKTIGQFQVNVAVELKLLGVFVACKPQQSIDAVGMSFF